MKQAIIVPLFLLKVDDILEYLSAHNIGTNAYFDKWIYSPLYGPVPEQREIVVQILSLQDMGFTGPVCHDEIGSRARALGLTPLWPSVALYLRMALLHQPESLNCVLSAHQSPEGAIQVYGSQIRDDEGRIVEPYLRNVGGKLWLRMAAFDADYAFPADTLFAFNTTL